MDFEELKVIWKNDEPLYAINREALHARVRNQGQVISKCVNAVEVIMLATFFILAIVVGSEPLLEGHDWHQLLDAIVYLIVAAYLSAGFLQRRRRERQFDPSLRGDLDKAISQLDHHIQRWRSLQWWCLLPLTITTFVHFLLKYDSKPPWIWLMVVGGLSVTFIACRWEVRQKLLPKKRDLESLRDLLTGEPAAN